MDGEFRVAQKWSKAFSPQSVENREYKSHVTPKGVTDRSLILGGRFTHLFGFGSCSKL